MELWIDIFMDALMDSLKLLPFLFLTYLLMEYLEHKTSTRTRAWIRKAGKLGPIAGATVGIFPVDFRWRPRICIPAVLLRWEHWLPSFYRLPMRCFRSFYPKQ